MRKKSKNFIHRKLQVKMSAYMQNAHLIKHREMRQQIQQLEFDNQLAQQNHKLAQSETRMAKNDAKKGEAFLKNHKKKGGSK